MTLSLAQTYTAIGPGLTASFLGSGGSRPYTYSVLAGGAGGTIDSRSGVYTAPATLGASPKQTFDTVRVTDNASATATATIVVGSPLLLFCNIIETGMGLANGRVYLWDQKIIQPTDYELYIVVSVPMCKPFGNNRQMVTDDAGNVREQQFVNMYARLDLDIISRGPAARDRKEEVILALNSNYSEQQQEANSFSIGRISNNFINLSNVDGAAIPYRYRISCAMQYTVKKISQISYFDSFIDPTIAIDT